MPWGTQAFNMTLTDVTQKPSGGLCTSVVVGRAREDKQRFLNATSAWKYMKISSFVICIPLRPNN